MLRRLPRSTQSDTRFPSVALIQSKLSNPLFSRASVARLSEKASHHAREQVDKFVDRRRCEFKTEFAELLPVAIFLDLMGWPQDLAPMFRKWAFDLIHSDSADVRAECVRSITDYLREMIANRRAKPMDDATSCLVHSRIDDEAINDDAMLGLLTRSEEHTSELQSQMRT